MMAGVAVRRTPSRYGPGGSAARSAALARNKSVRKSFKEVNAFRYSSFIDLLYFASRKYVLKEPLLLLPCGVSSRPPACPCLVQPNSASLILIRLPLTYDLVFPRPAQLLPLQPSKPTVHHSFPHLNSNKFTQPNPAFPGPTQFRSRHPSFFQPNPITTLTHTYT